MSEYHERLENEDRFRRLVQGAESPGGLEWIRRKAERLGYLTPELVRMILQREEEIWEERRGLPF